MMQVLADFHFLRPWCLLLLVPGAALAWMLWRQRGREASWSRVIDAHLLPHLITSESVSRSRSGVPALFLAWTIGALAAAGPSWEQLPQPVLQKQDALVLVMDLSYSMLSTDLPPSRQDRVRRKLLDLLQERREGLTALIAYAGDAHIVAPLTDDNPTIANLLPALNPGMMPLPGSNPVEAVERALSLLDSAGVRRGRILLVTDGMTESDSESIQDLLADQTRELGILGVGTEVGAPIALPGGGFLKDDNGDIVVPALDDSILRNLAGRTGGRYETMSVNGRDLRGLLDGPILVDENDTISLDRRADQWQDMGHWLVLPLLLIALASFRRGWLFLLPLFVFAPAESSYAFEWQDLWLRKDQQALQALAEGDTESAEALFEDPTWRGTAAYTGENYDTAAGAFEEDDSADGWYNRGNALAGQGKFDDAIAAYEKSLELMPDQDDAKQNIETLKKARDQQQSQQGDASQQQDPQDGQQDQQQQQQGDQDSENQNSQQQSQDQQSQQNQQNQQSQSDADSDSSSDQQQNAQQDQQESEGQEPQDEDPGSQGDDEQREQSGGRPMPSPDIDNSAMQEDIEKDQAMQQWLRRIPDDPSGLLREKFRYESRLRQQQGKSRESKQIW